MTRAALGRVHGGVDRRTALAMSLAAALMFGSQYVVIKDGVGQASPFLFGAMAMLIGGGLALLLVRRRKGVELSIFRRWEVWAGMAVAASMIACQYVGLKLATASVGGLIVGSNIIFVAPLSALLFGEVIGWKRGVGIIIGLFGLFTITTGWDLSIIGSSTFLGYVLLLGASLSIALNYPLTKLAGRHMSNDEWVMSFHLLSAVPLLFMAALDGGIVGVGTISLPGLLYVGLFCTSVPTLLWATGLGALSFTTSATVLLSESVFAVVLGAVVLNEPLGLITLIGGIMVLAAIVLVASGGGTEKQQNESE